jgi:hypothetical protein
MNGMKVDQIVLWRNVQANEDIGSFSAYNAALLPNGSPEVYLTFATDEEYEYTLHLGDTFPVRDQVWKLDKVENAGTKDWVVVLQRVE